MIYEIKEATGRYWVGHEDESGEWWDADIEGFSSLEEAEEFLLVCCEEQPDEDN